jgi:Domain of unknown function (DUF4124)
MVRLARLRFAFARAGCAVLLAALIAAPALASSTVYKWVDEYGTVHLSTSKPPAGVQYQTLNLGSSTSRPSKPAASGGSASSKKTAPAATPAQVAERSEVLASLQTRECVIALESLDRLTSGTKATSASELTRLKQTADRNCSSDPALRAEQEAMAAKLRVANGPECVAARNELADMMEPGARVSRDQLKARQAFVDEHCLPPLQ